MLTHKKTTFPKECRFLWFYNKFILFLVCFYPLACIDECFNPRSDLVVPSFGWIITALPWEDGTFRVWHDSQVTTVLASHGSYTIWWTVRVTWVFVVRELSYYIVFVFRQRQMELTFTVSYPCTNLEAAEWTEHYAAVGWDGEWHEAAFELVRVVVKHLGLLVCRVFRKTNTM